MKTLELKKDLYYTGIIDADLRVFDIVMYTEFGTTYNSYLLKSDEGAVLFETAKEKFFDEYLKEITALVDISDIKYLIVDHTEPDHSGSIEKLLQLNPKIKIVASKVAITFLRDIVNHDFEYIEVKDGDELKLLNKTLRFISVPNLHWPDTMYTYIVEDKVLVTCDSFGAHFATEAILLSKVQDRDNYLKAAKYYFDNILGPFKSFMIKALDRIKDLDIDIICTGHGPVVDEGIAEMMTTYRKWCIAEHYEKKTVVIAYVSAYGYTQMLADKIASGIKDEGVDVKMYDLVKDDIDTTVCAIGKADGLLLGSPTILGDALKPIYDVTSALLPIVHGGKWASAFGSFGWSGEAVGNLLVRLKQLRMKVADDGFKVKFKPTAQDLERAYEFGKKFAGNIK